VLGFAVIAESFSVIRDNRDERAKWASGRELITLVADATKDETLKQARVDTAKGLVAAISSDVATGRKINGRDGFTAVSC